MAVGVEFHVIVLLLLLLLVVVVVVVVVVVYSVTYSISALRDFALKFNDFFISPPSFPSVIRIPG